MYSTISYLLICYIILICLPSLYYSQCWDNKSQEHRGRLLAQLVIPEYQFFSGTTDVKTPQQLVSRLDRNSHVLVWYLQERQKHYYHFNNYTCLSTLHPPIL